MFLRNIFLVLLALSNLLTVNTYSQEAKFDHLTIEDGISNSRVLCILQDSKGLLWFGTEDGLNKYDGYKVTVYKYDPNNPKSLSNDKIYALYEDNAGRLWIGTQGGLNLFNRKDSSFQNWKHSRNSTESLTSNTIVSISGEPDKNNSILWLGTIDGLNKFDYQKNKFSQFKINAGKSGTRFNNVVFTLFRSKNNKLWIGTQTGLALFDTLKEKYIDNIGQLKSIKKIINDMVISIYIDADEIWVGTFSNGLLKINTNNGSIKHFINDLSSPLNIIKNSISTIVKDKKDLLWIGTLNGTYRYDKNNNTLINHKTDTADIHSINNNSIRTIYQDQTGIIWFGTHNGINKYDYKKNNFLHYRKKLGTPNSLRNNDVRSIFQDKTGNLIIGTKKGLNILSQNNKKFSKYKKPLNSIKNSITYIYSRNNKYNNLWIGTDSGLKIFNTKTYNISTHRHKPKEPTSISDNHIKTIFIDSLQRIWIGTFNGLNKFNQKNNTFIHWKNDPNKLNSISHNDITSIIEVKNFLWIGTHKGLNKFDYNKNTFIHYKSEPNNDNSLSNNIVYTLINQRTIKNDTIWIGTDYGLSKMSINNNSDVNFKSYYKDNGLPNNKIYSILIDDQGFLWLSTNKGLSKFNPKTEVFKNYDRNDGLQSDQFSKAAFKNKDGKMFFGGPNGFNAFYPHKIKINNYLSKIILTDFKKFYKSYKFDKSISELSEIHLSYKDYIFSFEFASLDFTSPQKNKFAYKMTGLNNDWIYIGARHDISFTNLSPGNYTLYIKASNNDEIWNEKGISIKIFIHPPFWSTWWFRILVLFLLIAIIIGIYKIKTARMIKRNIELQKEINERKQIETELRKSEDSVRELKNKLEKENLYLQEEIKLGHNFGEIIGNSSKIKKVLSQVEKVAIKDSTILILGETGTGKELIARAVHNLSSRKDRPLVKVNCAALPATLIESELFGHEKGAFTGATTKRPGRFELADKGTLFLDEIGDLQLELQVKLLRILQEGEFERLGGTKTLKVDVRLIAATNQNLQKLIEEGKFREDLYYRLNVFPLQLPSLNQRKEDIPLLVNHFINKYSTKTGDKIKTVSKNIMEELQNYPWQGNIRELENIIERAMIISPKDQLKLGSWFVKAKQNQSGGKVTSLEDIQKNHILMVLEKTNWQIRGQYGAAKLLDVKPTTLEAKIKKLSLNRK